ncbi:hypothetical protein N752_17325 [Desulforamulus aquiferis]|nr:hypothetical protein N752_17325 [Desulforamulus aquiferis]
MEKIMSMIYRSPDKIKVPALYLPLMEILEKLT